MNDAMTYSQLKERLDQIVEAVNDESLPLDDALTLYEEAVKLGSAASALIEEDINAKTADELAQALADEQAAEQAGEQPADAPAPEEAAAAADAGEGVVGA